MLNYFILLISYLSNPNLRLIEKQIQNKKFELYQKNLTYKNFLNFKKEIKFLELNRLGIIIREKLD